MIELYNDKQETLDRFAKATEAVGDMNTEDMTELYYQLNAIMDYAKPLHERLKQELKNRVDEGGKDEKGHSYIAGRTGSAKVERRVKITLKPDAELILDNHGLLDEFPLKPNYDSMVTMLEQLPVDPWTYSDHEVIVETLTELVEDGIIDPALAKELLDVKEFFAVKSMDTKELPDG